MNERTENLKSSDMAATPATSHSLPLVHRFSIEGWLTFWFITSPFLNFYLRFPAEKSLFTFDRAALALAALLVMWRCRHNPTQSWRATKFELAWLWFSIVGLVSAAAMSNPLAPALKVAIDALFLPLIAFHLARHHLDFRAQGKSLFAGAMALALALLCVGLFEMVTGVNEFAYKGSDILREGEIRVNGPYLSDSSLAVIGIALFIFLRAAKIIFQIKLDRTAHLIYLCALGAAAAVTLMTLYRSAALTLFLCMAGFEVLKRLRRREPPAKQRTGQPIADPQAQRQQAKNRALAYVITLLLIVSTVAVALNVSEISNRIANPRNAYGRLATWLAASKIAMENPIFGVGLLNYTDYFAKKYAMNADVQEMVGDARAARTPHANLFWVAAELGSMGLLFYLLAGVWVFQLGARALRQSSTVQQRAAAACFIAIAAAYFLVGLTLTSGIHAELNLFCFFLLGLLANKFITQS